MSAQGEAVLAAEVRPATPRWRRRFGPALACLCGGALAGALVAAVKEQPPPSPVFVASAAPVEIHNTVAPIYVPVAVAPAPAADAVVYRPGTCPDVEAGHHTRVGTPVGREPSVIPQLFEVAGAAVSPARFGVLAAHDGDSVWLSHDDGATFRRVLDGPGPVRAMDVDCFGRVFALRGTGQLGVHDDAGERWHRVDGLVLDDDDDVAEGRVRLAANGGYVAIVGPRAGETDQYMMVISADGGASLRYRDLSYADAVADLRITAAGLARVITRWTDCMSEGLNLIELDLGGERQTVREVGGYFTGDVRWGADGWVYTADEQACTTGVCAIAPGSRRWRPVTRVPDLDRQDGECPDESEGMMAAGHGPTYVQLAGELYRLRRGRGRKIGDGPSRAGFTDPQGRLLDTSGGELVRWSRRRGGYVLRGRAQ